MNSDFFSSLGTFAAGISAILGSFLAIREIAGKSKSVRNSIFWEERLNNNLMTPLERGRALHLYKRELGKVYGRDWVANNFGFRQDHTIIFSLLVINCILTWSLIEGSNTYIGILIIYALVSPVIIIVTLQVLSEKFSRELVSSLFENDKNISGGFHLKKLWEILKSQSRIKLCFFLIMSLTPFVFFSSGMATLFMIIYRIFNQSYELDRNFTIVEYIFSVSFGIFLGYISDMRSFFLEGTPTFDETAQK